MTHHQALQFPIHAPTAFPLQWREWNRSAELEGRADRSSSRTHQVVEGILEGGGSHLAPLGDHHRPEPMNVE
jgi:hypothetical protein